MGMQDRDYYKQWKRDQNRKESRPDPRYFPKQFRSSRDQDERLYDEPGKPWHWSLLVIFWLAVVFVLTILFRLTR